MVKNSFDAFVFVFGLVFGTASSILSKALYGLKVNDKAFEKPLFQTTMMFLGMVLALPVHFTYVKYKKSKSRSAAIAEGYSNLDEVDAVEEEEVDKLTFKDTLVLFIPSFFDLVATALANIGLVMIEVSVYQLMKCTVIVFVAIFKRTLMKTNVKSYMWAGVLLNMIAVTLVASSSLFTEKPGEDPSSGNHNAGFGILLVVASCAIQAGQYVFEEKAMDGSGISYPPLIVVGMEGFWGLIMSLCIVLPVAQYLPGKDCNAQGVCSYENTFDTLDMVSNSSTAAIMLFSYVLIITGYNAAGIGITFLLDSIWHSILDNFRPISVWGTQLIIFKLTNGSSGEEWVTTSWLQLAGLFVLLFGTAVYNGNLELPCFYYDKNEVSFPEDILASASPFVTSRSPMFRHRAQLQQEEEQHRQQEQENLVQV